MSDEFREPHMEEFRFPGETRNMADDKATLAILKSAILEVDQAQSFTEICISMVKIKRIAAEIRNSQ